MTQKGHHASGTEALYPDFFYYPPYRSALQPRSARCHAPAGAVGMLRRRNHRLPERHRNP